MFSTQARMNMQSGVGGPIAGLGFGLPMSRVYGISHPTSFQSFLTLFVAKYFGGSLILKSVPGHGCDVFVRLPNIKNLASVVQI